MTPEYFQRFARYNRWANRCLYAACASLSDSDRQKDRGAFFGSIHNSLNHILVGDKIWTSRLDGTNHGIGSLDEILYTQFEPLVEAREAEDLRIIDVVDGLSEDTLASVLRYQSMDGTAQETRRDMVLAHFFNHQTHHRGQVHCMVSQTGADAPPLDLIYFLRDS
jgi:uncharacterized damage-inducible protein DinB